MSPLIKNSKNIPRPNSEDNKNQQNISRNLQQQQQHNGNVQGNVMYVYTDGKYVLPDNTNTIRRRA